MERVEEYLEAIYDIQENENRVAKTGDLANILNVKPSSVTEMLIKLKDLGYVDYQPYRGAKLTKKGEEVAKRIKKYYLALLVFFRDYLEIEEEIASKLSCELEHHITEDAFVRICRIIAGDCEVCDFCTQELVSLNNVVEGEFLVVVAPSKLGDVGIKPGKKIIVSGDDVTTENGTFRVNEDLRKFVILSRF
ncbi:metal-dependent transcriptional regulator [Archaeoglobus neptunius]|uniref:metal-dependent transcriptional regulator n=1 Tax=Archaeoglobus neptunius TaxID=2798580 RepID=UPI0019285AEA|nr:metal-dependent transcriptional regulator [Archaeoglobus neptunius]